ncbi:MAG: DnaT-like ssDNA-binding protein [Casimicrobium sp.]
MSLIVEDGTGKEDAESYASVAFATTYFSKRGVAAWDDVDDKEVALRKATDYMRQVYGGRWKGEQVYLRQSLDWPRYGVVLNGFDLSSSIVPLDVQKACCELALKSESGELLPDIEAQVVRETIGPITTEYAPGARQSPSFRVVDGYLNQYLSGGGSFGGFGSMKVVRA